MHNLHDSSMMHSDLGASGFTYTDNDIIDWVNKSASEIIRCLGVNELIVSIWGYREQSSEWLGIDISNNSGISFPITVLTGKQWTKSFVSIDEPRVYDMVEALHLAGILSEYLKARVIVGRRSNEINRCCTPKEWLPGQTNAHLKIE